MADGVLTLGVFHEPTGWSLPESHAERIREAAGSHLEFRRATSRAELIEALPDTTHLIGLSLTEEGVRAHGGALRWVQQAHSSGDGVDSLEALLEAGVRVCSAGSIRAPFVAEHAMALCLAMLRNVDAAVRAQAEHAWSAGEMASSMGTLMGCRVGIIAMDSVDEEIARRAKAFGAETMALSRLASGTAPSVDHVVDRGDIDEIVRGADVLFVAMPRIGNDRLVDASRVGMMKSSSILVDVSRGGVVDHEALLRSLRRNRIAGAALDVFDREPLPRTSPLWTMANVIVSPHVASAGPAYWDRATDVFCENVRRVVSGGGELIDELSAAWYGVAAAGV